MSDATSKVRYRNAPAVCPACCVELIARGLADQGDRCPTCSSALFGAPADQDTLLLRYAHAILDAFPGEHDARPAKALHHWREHFAPYAAELKAEIADWYAVRQTNPKSHVQNPKFTHRTLTELLWSVADRIFIRGEGYRLMDFNRDTSRCHLRTGLLELGKLLCREVEADHAKPTAQ